MVLVGKVFDGGGDENNAVGKRIDDADASA
jgi:hypothetical protein